MRAAWQYFTICVERQKAVSKMFFVEIGKKILLFSGFRNLEFPELENSELEAPGT